MKFLLAALVLLSLSSTVRAELVTDTAITFSKSDFDNHGWGQKSLLINRPVGEYTEVWSVENARMDAESEQGDGRLKIGSTSRPNSEIVWKIVVPNDIGIEEFEWAVSRVQLTGTRGAEAYFRWEYSVDGEDWKELFSIQNTAEDSPEVVDLKNSQLSGEFEKPYPHSFFIRARNTEEDASGLTSYYAIYSAYPDGGESPDSYISLTVDESK